MKYLGHGMYKEGIKTDPDKIQCVADWPVPNDVRKLKCFLGLASYYRRFIKNFAQITAPLHALSNSGTKWEWSNSCNDAFFELNKQLMTSRTRSDSLFSTQMLAWSGFVSEEVEETSCAWMSIHRGTSIACLDED